MSDECARMLNSKFFWMGVRDGTLMALAGWATGVFCGWLIFG